MEILCIKACVGQHDPSALLFFMGAIVRTTAFQRLEMSHIAAGSESRLPGKNVLTARSNRISTFQPVFVGPATACLVVQTGLSRRKTSAVGGNDFFLNILFLQNLVLHLLKVQLT